MDRVADILHVGFAIRPEWNPETPLHWSNIHVETIPSRQVAQLPGWGDIVARIGDILRKELGVAHLLQFCTKLEQISPGIGYRIDSETRRAIVGNIIISNNDNDGPPPALLNYPMNTSLPTSSSAPASPSPLSSNTQQDTSLGELQSSQQLHRIDEAAPHTNASLERTSRIVQVSEPASSLYRPINPRQITDANRADAAAALACANASQSSTVASASCGVASSSQVLDSFPQAIPSSSRVVDSSSQEAASPSRAVTSSSRTQIHSSRTSAESLQAPTALSRPPVAPSHSLSVCII